MYTLYLIHNTVNDKFYVGQTSLTSKERWDSHYWSSRKKDYFHYAIRKYGRSAFEVQDIAQFETREEVSNAEKLWIILLRSSEKEFGYNTTLGGEYGASPTAEVKEKMAASHRGKRHSEQTKQLMGVQRSGVGNGFFGKSHTPETVAKIKEKCSELRGENAPWFGKILSQQHRDNISKSKKNVKQKPRSASHCQSISEAAKRRWARWREQQGDNECLSEQNSNSTP